MTSFEDRLLVELRHVVAARPEPAPRRGKLVWAGATAALAAIAAAIVVTLSGGAAYAVESEPDGKVTVQVKDLSDAAGLQRELREAGVPATVTTGAHAQPACGFGVGPGAPPSGDPPVRDYGLAAGPKRVGPERGLSSGQDGSGPSTSAAGVPGASPERQVTTGVSKTADGASFTIDRAGLQTGDHVYISTQTGKVDSLEMAICPGQDG